VYLGVWLMFICLTVKKKKIHNKSFRCVLLGVSEESKAYRLYDPISKKIVINRDIMFIEDEK
jgi:hypothetical protein